MDALLIERLILSTTAPTQQTKPTERYLQHARGAARRAAVLRKLNTVAHAEGFQPLSLPDYLSWVAQRSKVSLSSLLPPSTKGATPASIWISLAKAIGLAADRIRLHVRLWVAECFTPDEPSPLLAKAHLNGSGSKASRFEGLTEPQTVMMLNSAEAHYPSETKAHLEACLAEVGKTF